MKHYHVTPSDEYKCSCGKTFQSLSDISSHIDGHRYTEVTDGVARCPSCDGAFHAIPLTACNNVDHSKLKMRWDEMSSGSTFTIELPKHSWTTWQINPVPPFICKCGIEFDTHNLVMKHVESLNPSQSTLTDSAILKLLRRARDIILRSNDHYLVGSVDLLNDIKKQCPTLDEPEIENE